MTQAVALAQQASTGVSQGFKNRIINGAMVIDQRNAGAAMTTNGGYPVDRWVVENTTTTGTFSSQQDSSAPAGFVTSLKTTITAADASLSGFERLVIRQTIEGYNIADLNWGTSNAKTVTVSFWVRCSATGTFGGSLHNGAEDRSYPFEYTISAANTWEQKSITVPGDTTGTWLTTNGKGIFVNFSLGAASTPSGTANAWTNSFKISTTGATNLIATNGATFYITGVQLEVGSTATSFDYRPYGTELQLCERYYETGTAAFGGRSGDNLYFGSSTFRTVKRTTATFSGVGQTLNGVTDRYFSCYQAGSPSANSTFNWTASAEL